MNNLFRLFLVGGLLGINSYAFALSLVMRVGDINGSNTLYEVTEVMTNLVSQTELQDLDTSYRWFNIVTNENQSVQYVTLTYDYPTNLVIDLPRSGETKDWIVYVTAITNVTLQFPEVNWWARDASVFNDIQPNRPTALYFTQVASNTFVIGRQEIQPVALPSNNVAVSTRQFSLPQITSKVSRRDAMGRIGSKVFCCPTNEGKSLAYAPCIFPPNPAVPTEAEYNAHGFYRNAVQPPVIPSGKVVSSKTYVVENNEVVAQYEYDDAPIVMRIFAKHSLETALFNAGYLNAVDAYIDSQTITNAMEQTMPLRRVYNTATYIHEDSPYFSQARDSLKLSLGVSDEDIERVLIVAEGNYGL